MLTVPLRKQASDFSIYEGSTDPYIVDSLNAMMEEEMDGLLGMNQSTVLEQIIRNIWRKKINKRKNSKQN